MDAQKLMPYLCQDAQASFSFFINPGIKIDGCYYCDIVLMHQMLHSICSIAGDACVFQEDIAPAYETVELLQRETLKFIASDLRPPNNPDLNPIDYRI